MPISLYLIPIVALPAAVLALVLSRLPGTVFAVTLVGVAGQVLAAFAALITALYAFNSGPLTGGFGLLYVDALSGLILIVIALVSLLAITYSVPYMGRELLEDHITLTKLGWYYFWFNILTTAIYATVIFNSLGITWVLLESTTLAAAPLVGFYGKHQSLEAAWKYIVIATVGISFALLGTLLTYMASVSNLPESGSSLDWTFLLKNAANLNPDLMKLAFIFILIGFGTKTGLAPMHTWLPDAHSQAPSPISALLSGALLNCGLYGIMRFNTITKITLGPEYSSTLLIIFGLISIGIVIPFILEQDDFKRLLAYSSIEHMGIIVLAIGIGGEIGGFAAALHILNHAIAKSLMFCVAGEVTERYHTREIPKIKGVINANPLLGTLLFVGTLAITGVPPLNVFVSEALVGAAAFANNNPLVGCLYLILLACIFASLIHHVVGMAFGRGEKAHYLPKVDLSNHPLINKGVGNSLIMAGITVFSGSLSPFKRKGLPNWQFAAAEKREPKATQAPELETDPLTNSDSLDERLKLANRFASFILLAPAITLLVLGLWLPPFAQEWFHMVGTILK
ncbi:MAG: hydrogenase 4 subunit F [Chloroflexi bacterium]|uniref:Hydrogenase 4 subunit F n=1 Tax=Candidatus Chlorohelix allophototropha TaxID=3003348 RepID=A0A8T7LWN8_9CHLR|nr:hydrogenase 4 subunit F [Chloroflexota bacterium]WJW65745.1 hypothetical protein OZ401_001523 [Chloroflexota bacterium L227-S17]